MKTIIFILFQILPVSWAAGQNMFPATQLINTDGEYITSGEIFNSYQPTLVIFWDLGSAKCCENLDLMQDAWIDNLKEKGIRMVTICLDNGGNWSKIKPLVSGKDWQFEVYLDVNGNCKRSMQITGAPQTMLFDSKQNLICSYNGFCSGNEELICGKMLSEIQEKQLPLAIKY